MGSWYCTHGNEHARCADLSSLGRLASESERRRDAAPVQGRPEDLLGVWRGSILVRFRLSPPLLLCLCVIELSDVVFAVDSIPAVFGVTQDPFIVYSSNIFAILGLRSLYAFVATLVAELEYLQTAVAAVLGFVGCKMVAEFGGMEVSTEASLAVVVGMLGAGVALSLKKSDDDEKEA